MVQELIIDFINNSYYNFHENFFVLLLFTLGVAIYGILIYAFYHLVARRDVFGFDIEKYKHEQIENFISKIYNFLLEVMKYGFAFPVMVFLWFAGFSIVLFAFSSEQPIEDTLLIAITIVSAIRVTAYFREDLSRDLAKLLPLALLGNYLANPTFFSLELLNERVDMLFLFIPHIIQFLTFSVAIEWILRIIFTLRLHILGPTKDIEKQEEMELEDVEKKIRKK